MKRIPRQLSPVVSLAGRLHLLGLRPEIASSNGGDYNGLLLAFAHQGKAYWALWHLAEEDPMYWAFYILDAAGGVIFRSLAPLRTREGIAPLAPSRPTVPFFHVTTPPEQVANAVAGFDYGAILDTTTPVTDGAEGPSWGRRLLDGRLRGPDDTQPPQRRLDFESGGRRRLRLQGN